jgi:hypothetical protein
VPQAACRKSAVQSSDPRLASPGDIKPLLEAPNDVAQRAFTLFLFGCARVETSNLPGGWHTMVVIRNDRDVHSAATLRRSAQFSQHQASSSVLVFGDLFVIRHSRNAIRKPTRAS